MTNLYSGPLKKRKSGLVCLSRPCSMNLAIWANFGPVWPNISQGGWGTPTFYWLHRLYLPIGIQNCPFFCWCFFFIFDLGQNLNGDL